MKKLVDKVFWRYGVPIDVQYTQGVTRVYGFVEHATTSARRYLFPEYTSLGQVPPGHYLILLPLHTAREGQEMMYDGKWYIVRRAERVWMGKIALYDRCICEERGVSGQWGK